jgi:hypothetical protein
MSDNTALALYDALKREVLAESAGPAGRARLILALDATASREATWDHAARVQSEIFEAVAGRGGVAVKLVFYRGFNECRASRWLNNAASLHAAMAQVRCAAGETQIGRVLALARDEARQHRIGALVLVADAMEEGSTQLCAQAAELGSLRVPLFILQEGYDPFAAKTFQAMCRAANGACLPFDLASIGRLKALLGGIASYATGGFDALEAYGRKTGGQVWQLTQQLRLARQGGSV